MPSSQLDPSTLRIVAIRVDPCRRPVDGGCEHQVRLTAQPLVSSTTDQSITTDLALHFEYAFDDAE